MHTFDDPEEVYRLGVEAWAVTSICWPGSKYMRRGVHQLQKSDNKDDFIRFIKAQIDKGFPALPLG